MTKLLIYHVNKDKTTLRTIITSILIYFGYSIIGACIVRLPFSNEYIGDIVVGHVWVSMFTLPVILFCSVVRKDCFTTSKLFLNFIIYTSVFFLVMCLYLVVIDKNISELVFNSDTIRNLISILLLFLAHVLLMTYFSNRKKIKNTFS